MKTVTIKIKDDSLLEQILQALKKIQDVEIVETPEVRLNSDILEAIEEIETGKTILFQGDALDKYNQKLL